MDLQQHNFLLTLDFDSPNLVQGHRQGGLEVDGFLLLKFVLRSSNIQTSSDIVAGVLGSDVRFCFGQSFSKWFDTGVV